MKTIKFNKKAAGKGIVLALGNFDGVHKGHSAIFKDAISYAKKNGLECYAMTFDPHPQEIIVPQRGLKLLTTVSERIELMRDAGLDGVIIKKFDKKIASMSADKFIKDFLVDHLDVKKVYVGFDFAFGKGRSGNIAGLKKLGKKYGFEVETAKPIKVDGKVVKSSFIREMIAQGDLAEAVKLLGHPYYLEGKVVKGKGRGTGMGFPTANIVISHEKLIPKHGVYFAKWGGSKCAVFIGSRPTFGEESFAIEAHILGFKGNIRGDVIMIDLIKRLRDEVHFSDVNALIAQINKDVAKIRSIK